MTSVNMMNWQPSREMMNKQRANHERALAKERAKHVQALQQESAKRARLVQHVRGLQAGGGITKKQLRTKHRLEMALLEAKIKSQENKRRLIAAQLNNMAARKNAPLRRLNSPPPPPRLLNSPPSPRRLNRVNSRKPGPPPPPPPPPPAGRLLAKATPPAKTKAQQNANEIEAHKRMMMNKMAMLGFEIAAKAKARKSWTNGAESPRARRMREKR